MKDIRPLTAEFIGTFALIFIGAGAVCMETVTAGAMGHGMVGLTGIALAHGLAIFVMASALGHISGGHFNPAVTAAMLVTGRIPAGRAAAYVGAQLAGATAAAFALLVITRQYGLAERVPYLGACGLNGIGFGGGVIVEAAITFLLVTVIFGTAVDPDGKSSLAPLAIGLTISADILAAGPLTGASINPARAFGPAVASGIWMDHLVFWIGPMIGAIAAALLYDRVLSSERRK